jgi:hypothetical protein
MRADGTLVTVSQEGVGGKALDPARLIHFTHDGWFGKRARVVDSTPRIHAVLAQTECSPVARRMDGETFNAADSRSASFHTQEATVTKMLSVADRLQARTAVTLPEGSISGFSNRREILKPVSGSPEPPRSANRPCVSRA